MPDLLRPTASQTVGPFFHYALPFPEDNRLVAVGRSGAIRLHGTVFDGARQPIPDALIELWQGDADGNVVQRSGSLRRDGWTFTGWGRCATDGEGEYDFTTLRPGATTEGRPPFFALTVCARGLLRTLFTRAYLPEGHLDADPLLHRLDARRRHSLLCTAEPNGYRFDIHLQGDAETVFLDHTSADGV
jgi:protocatechuate 3,4-dioxygenase, alpha subunit